MKRRTRPARALLTPPLARWGGRAWTLRVVPDGALGSKHEVRWSTEGGRLEPVPTDPLQVRLVGAGRVTATLLQGGRPVASEALTLPAGPGLRLAGSAASVWAAGPGASGLRFDGQAGQADAGQWRWPAVPGQTLWAQDEAGRWVGATAGILPPDHGGEPVPLAAAGCADGAWPRRVGLAHVGCGSADDAGRGHLDRWAAAGAVGPLPHPPTRRHGDPVPAPAWRAAGGDGFLVGGALAVDWRPSGSRVKPLGQLTVTGRPVLAGDAFALARPDRVEWGLRSSNQRQQRGVGTVDEPGTLARTEAWVAVRDEAGVLLISGRGGRTGRIDRAAQRIDARSDWLLLAGPDEARAVPLRGGIEASAPWDAAFGPAFAWMDDWVLLPRRGEGLWGLHRPTGLVAPVVAGSQRVEARGSAVGRLSLRLAAWGTEGSLLERRAAVRVVEEHAGLAVGGHGGRHRWLAPGEEAKVRVQVGPGATTIDHAGGGSGSIEASWGTGSTSAAVAPRAEPPAWQPLGRVPAGEGLRTVEITLTAGPDGLAWDALRLREAS